MLNTLKNRFEQGYKTCNYPKEKPAIFPRYRGRPEIKKNIHRLAAKHNHELG